jgi:GntR family transcriptional regulator/MocR family aminotransferase
MEDPGYRGAKGALIAVGAKLAPVPVDSEGLHVGMGEATCPKARMAFVSQSHQHPVGVTMSLARRLALLDWAKRANAWIVEDDYDSEFRYSGRPLSALQGLDRADRVIYAGTFSKVLFPALRLGYVVAPMDQIEAFTRIHTLTNRQMPTVDQAVVADFITQGHFARHIRSMRALYAERQDLMVNAMRRELDDQLEINCAEAGLHVVGWLPEGVDDKRASQAAFEYGVETPPVSRYAMTPIQRGGLLLGYAALNERQIRDGARRLRQALKNLR